MQIANLGLSLVVRIASFRVYSSTLCSCRYPDVPGIYGQAQILQWKKITEAVKAQGATFYCQLWHTGRVSHTGLFKCLSVIAAHWINVDSCNITMHVHMGLHRTSSVEQDKKDKTIPITQLRANKVALQRATVLECCKQLV